MCTALNIKHIYIDILHETAHFHKYQADMYVVKPGVPRFCDYIRIMSRNNELEIFFMWFLVQAKPGKEMYLIRIYFVY